MGNLVGELFTRSVGWFAGISLLVTPFALLFSWQNARLFFQSFSCSVSESNGVLVDPAFGWNKKPDILRKSRQSLSLGLGCSVSTARQIINP
jgi:hypothetical protein